MPLKNKIYQLSINMNHEVISKAAAWGLEFIATNPGYAMQVNDLYDLLQLEIEEGGSPEHEFELFTNSVEQLLKQQ